MIRFEHTDVVGWEHAIRGMRNPMNSWDKSDSKYGCKNSFGDTKYCDEEPFCPNWYECYGAHAALIIGKNDHDLMKRLVNAGSDHRKFMRMIVVYVDITAPLYWWKEFDTYKVGTVANSCSTMHKIHDKEFKLDDFSYEQLIGSNAKTDEVVFWNMDCFTPMDLLELTVDVLNRYRKLYNQTGDKRYWEQMIHLLPTNYEQKRTVMLNYEALRNMYHARKAHKLDEWREGFCKWVEGLPYSELITK